MNNQLNYDNNLTFGNGPMNYDNNLDQSGQNEIFDAKGGTNISSLVGKNINVNENNINNLPIEHIKQTQYQQNMQYNNKYYPKQVNFNSEPHITEYSNDDTNNSADIKFQNMAKEYNKSLNDYTTSSTSNTLKLENEEDNNEANNKYKYMFIKDAVLIFMIYVILSQDIFKKYIFQLVPVTLFNKFNFDTNMVYILIYGLLLSISFIICKKILV